MSRPKNVTLESFDPQILDLLMQATTQPIRIDVPAGVNPFKYIVRFRHFAAQMREEQHILASQVARIAIRWDAKASAIILESRDEGLRALKVRRADGTELTPYAEVELPGPDPLETMLLRPDPNSYLRSAAVVPAPKLPEATSEPFASGEDNKDPSE